MQRFTSALRAWASATERRSAMAAALFALAAVSLAACAPPAAATRTPSPTPTPRPPTTSTPVPAPTLTPTVTPTPLPTATPTATVTPSPAEAAFAPELIAMDATEAGVLSDSRWGEITRWIPQSLGWSVELPIEGEWSFVRTEWIEGRLETAEYSQFESAGPTVSFQLTLMDAGGAQHLGATLDCDERIEAAATKDGVETGRSLSTAIGGSQGEIARASHSPPGTLDPGEIAYACVIIDESLFLIRTWSAPASTEFDLLSMLYSFRIES